MSVYEETGNYFIEHLQKWRSEYPELDDLGIKLLEYQQELQLGNISKFEFERLAYSITDIREVEKKLKKTIKLDKLQEALDFLKFLSIIAIKAIVII